jgi:hypothetical protein
MGLWPIFSPNTKQLVKCEEKYIIIRASLVEEEHSRPLDSSKESLLSTTGLDVRLNGGNECVCVCVLFNALMSRILASRGA